MSTTRDPNDAIRHLEPVGAEPKLAQAIASLLATAAKPAPGATITAAMGWFVVVEIRQTRSELIAAINANTARIETLSERTTALGERLTRVETLIQERLPSTP